MNYISTWIGRLLGIATGHFIAVRFEWINTEYVALSVFVSMLLLGVYDLFAYTWHELGGKS